MRTGLLFNIIFCFVFLFQSTVEASTHPMSRVMERLAGMTNQEKITELEKHYSKEDLAPLNKMGDWKKVKFPEITQKDGDFSFKVEGKNFTFKVLKPYVISFKGQEIDVSPGKLPEAIHNLESILTKPEFSLLDYFISNSYAVVLLVDLIIGAILAVCVVALMVTVMITPHYISRMCKDAREKLDQAEGTLTAEDYRELEFLIDRKLTDISVADCNGSEAKERCDKAKKCLNQLKGEINQRKNAINNSGRNLLKEYAPPVTKEAWPVNKKGSAQ